MRFDPVPDPPTPPAATGAPDLPSADPETPSSESSAGRRALVPLIPPRHPVDLADRLSRQARVYRAAARSALIRGVPWGPRRGAAPVSRGDGVIMHPGGDWPYYHARDRVESAAAACADLLTEYHRQFEAAEAARSRWMRARDAIWRGTWPPRGTRQARRLRWRLMPWRMRGLDN